MLTLHVYNIQLKSNNMSPLLNGKIGKMKFWIIPLEATIYYIGVAEKRDEREKKKVRGGISEVY